MLLDLAQVLRALGRAAEALAPARRLVELAPDQADARRLLGVVLHDAGQPETAQVALQQALDMDPTLVDAMVDLGGLLIEQSKVDEAIPLLGRRDRRSPKALSAWANLGIARDLAGQTEPAVDAYEHALAIEPRPGLRLRCATVLLPSTARARTR